MEQFFHSCVFVVFGFRAEAGVPGLGMCVPICGVQVQKRIVARFGLDFAWVGGFRASVFQDFSTVVLTLELLAFMA